MFSRVETPFGGRLIDNFLSCIPQYGFFRGFLNKSNKVFVKIYTGPVGEHRDYGLYLRGCSDIINIGAVCIKDICKKLDKRLERGAGPPQRGVPREEKRLVFRFAEPVLADAAGPFAGGAAGAVPAGRGLVCAALFAGAVGIFRGHSAGLGRRGVYLCGICENVPPQKRKKVAAVRP